MNVRTTSTALIIALTAVSLSGAASQRDRVSLSGEAPQRDRGTSEKFGVATYREKGPVTVIVDSYPASLHKGDPYVPVRIAIAMRQKGRPVRLNEESFTLIHARGHAVPLASYREVMKYGKRANDETLFRHRPMRLGSQFENLFQLESRFFPPPGRGTRTSRDTLYTGTWFRDVLYFRRPQTGLNGLLTLRITSRDLDEPLEVRFRVD